MIRKYSEEDLSFLIDSILDDLHKMLKATLLKDQESLLLANIIAARILHEDRLEEMDR